MSRTHLFLILGIVVIAGLLLWLVGGNTANAPEATNDQDMSTESTGDDTMSEETRGADEMSGVATIQALIERGESLRCTYEFSSATDGSGTGEGFFADGQMRIEAEYTDVDGEMYETTMIDDGETLYTWSSGAEGDFAMMFDSPDDPTESAVVADENSGQIDTETEVTYDCEAWSVDESVFTPPSDIEFMDLDTMMQGMMQNVSQ